MIKQAEFEAEFQRAGAAFRSADYSTAINLLGTLEPEFDRRAAQMLLEAIELRQQRGKVLDKLMNGLEKGDVRKAVEQSAKYIDAITQRRVLDSEVLRLYRECELRIEQAERAELKRRRLAMAVNGAKVLVPLVGLLVGGTVGLKYWDASVKAQKLGIALATQSWDEALAISPDSVETIAKVILKRVEKIAMSDPLAAYKELSQAAEFGANSAAVEKLRLQIQVAQKQKLVQLTKEGDLVAAANLMEQISKLNLSYARTLLNELPAEKREALKKLLEDRLGRF